MTTDRRELEDWEKDECAALKRALARYNASASKNDRFTQERLASELGMAQGNLNGHLNGKRPLNVEMAAKVFALTGIPVDEYSSRLAEDIRSLAASIQPGVFSGVATQARELAEASSPRSRSALEKIAEAADSGLLSEEDVLLLEVIANRLASQGKNQTESPHQRLRKKLTKHDPDTQ